MTDIDKELRELFEEKTRNARTMPSAPPAVLKRGRRRQAGTVFVGATTAILVAVASIAILRSVGPGRATTPGSNDLAERTATIQNFTVTAPAGWTLIDWWPISRNLITAVTTSGFTPSSPTTASLAGVVPVLQVSNFDPGLGAALWCGSGGQLGSNDAMLYVAANAAAMRTAAGPLLLPPWPVQLSGDGAPQTGPCGNGYYARFSLHGYPYFAFVGFGSDVDDAVRQQTLDIFSSMHASDAGLTAPAGSTPGYVMAAGLKDGVPWSLELGIAPPAPSTSAGMASAWLTVVEDAEHVTGHWQVSGPGGTDDAMMVPVRTGGIVAGSVHGGAERVEYLAPDGTTSTASILSVPDELRSTLASRAGVVADRIFWVPGDPSSVGQIVQFVDGVPTTENVTLVTAVPTAADLRARMYLRNALVAALTHYTDHASFVGFTPKLAASIEPSLTYNTSPTVIAGEISIRDITESTVLLVTASGTSEVWCIADDTSTDTTTYGVGVDAQTAVECVGGEAAWSVVTATPTPTSSPTSSPSSSLHAIETGTDLGVTWTLLASLDQQQYCVEFDAENTGSGTCGASAQGGPPGPSADTPAQVTTVPVAGGEFLIESVPDGVRRIEVEASSGATFTGTCVEPNLISALMAKGIRFCVVPLTGSDTGTIRFLAADGSELFPSRSIDWSNQGSTGATGSSGSSGP